MLNTMTIQEFTDRFKLAKLKDLEIIFRTENKDTLSVGGIFYGVKGEDNTILTPQVGDEPNCVVVQVAAPVKATAAPKAAPKAE